MWVLFTLMFSQMWTNVPCLHLGQRCHVFIWMYVVSLQILTNLSHHICLHLYYCSCLPFCGVPYLPLSHLALVCILSLSGFNLLLVSWLSKRSHVLLAHPNQITHQVSRCAPRIWNNQIILKSHKKGVWIISWYIYFQINVA